MALQINGTTVVNNSRQLQNIASADSTTQNTINSFVSGGDAIIPSASFTFIYDISSASLAAGTYFVTYAGYISSTRTFNLPTSNVTAGLIYHANPREWYAYDGSNWKNFRNSTVITTETYINGSNEHVWGWFKCSGTTTVSLSGGGSQRLGYRKLD